MNKKNRWLVAGVLTMVLAGGIFVSTGTASSVQPGSAEDPVVTKSYVDEKIQQQLSGIGTTGTGGTTPSGDQIVSDVIAQIEFLYGDKLKNTVAPANNAPSGSTDTYIPVNAIANQIIIGGEGTEIILRSGSAVGFCSGDNGLVNVTDGKEIKNGTQVSQNNMLIVPRADGRGVKVTADAWFIIKGGYSIIE